MKVYLAGPMTGLPQFNFPAFDAASENLRARGFEVVSPAELDDPEDRVLALASSDGRLKDVTKSWGQFLGRDIIIIMDGGIEAIFVLPGWQRSSGARLETFVGRAIKGIYVWDFETGEMVSILDLTQAWLGGLWTELKDAVKVRFLRAAREAGLVQ